MPTRKRYADALRPFDREQLYGPAEAVDLVKDNAKAKFDESVELATRLGVDPRKADQMVRGTVSLPAGTGKPVRVAVFAFHRCRWFWFGTGLLCQLVCQFLPCLAQFL